MPVDRDMTVCSRNPPHHCVESACGFWWENIVRRSFSTMFAGSSHGGGGDRSADPVAAFETDTVTWHGGLRLGVCGERSGYGTGEYL